MKGLQEVLAARDSLQEPAVLATLVSVKGSSYRKPGARTLFRAGGGQTGVLSAGCLETDVQARIASVLEGGAPQVVGFDLGSDLDLIWGTGMGCQGQVRVLLEAAAPGPAEPWMTRSAGLLAARRHGALATVFTVRGAAAVRVGDRYLLDSGGPGLPPPPGPIAEALARALAGGPVRTLTLASGDGEADLLVEPLLPPYALWIFGAGEHARPLAALAKALGWFVGVIDHRPALATAERFPQADRIVLAHPPESLQGLPLDARSAVLVVSHVYDKDLQAVAAFCHEPLGYLGLQGNRARSARILKEAQAPEGAVRFPAGLDIGAEAPETIALSMLAEVQAVLSGHAGGSLGDRPGAIHRPQLLRRDGASLQPPGCSPTTSRNPGSDPQGDTP